MSDVLISIGLDPSEAKAGRDQIVRWNDDIAASYDKVLAASKAAGGQNAGAGLGDMLPSLTSANVAAEKLAATFERLSETARRPSAPLTPAISPDTLLGLEKSGASARQAASAFREQMEEAERLDAALKIHAANRMRDMERISAAQAAQNARQMSPELLLGTQTSGASARDSASVFRAAFDEQEKLEAAHKRATAAIMTGEQQRAQAAQKAAADQARAIKSLEASILPLQAAQERLTQQTIAWDRAMLTGAISMEKWKAGAAALTAQKAMLTQETTRAAGGFGNLRFAVMNASQQMQDMIIVGRSADMGLGQMGIQVAQLISGFGTFGVVAGIAVTAGGFLAQSLLQTGDASEEAKDKAKLYSDSLKDLVKIEEDYNAALRARAGLPALPKETENIEREMRNAQGRRRALSGPGMRQDDWLSNLQQSYSDWRAGGKSRRVGQTFAEEERARINMGVANDTLEAADRVKLGTTIDDISKKRAQELEIVRLSTSGQERQAAVLKAENEMRERLKGRIEISDADIKAQVAAAGAAAGAMFDMEAAHKASEKAANDNQRALEKLNREAEQAKQQYDKSVVSLKDYNQNLDNQRAMLSMSEREATVSRTGVEAEAIARRANGGAITEETAALIEQAKTKAGQNFDTKETQGKRLSQDQVRSMAANFSPEISYQIQVQNVEKYRDALVELGVTEEQIAQAIQEANLRKLESSQTWSDGATAALQRYSINASNYGSMAGRVVSNGMQSMENAIVGFSSKTMTAAQAFKSMASSIIQDLIRMQVQANITGPLSKALSAGIGGWFSSDNAYMSGSNSMGSIDTSSISTASTGTSFSAPMAFASGTDSAPSGWAIVGEQGPELMQLGGGERIYPADETQSMLSPKAANSNATTGGNVVQIANYVEAGASMSDVEAAVASGIQQAAPHLVAAAVQQSVPASVSAVQAAANRGGSFAQSVGRR